MSNTDNTDNKDNKNTRQQYYFVPPPFVNSIVEYQNVNNDPQLRKNITEFYYNKTIKWIKKYKDFSHLKSKMKILETTKGEKLIYNLLRQYVNNANINWYDLKDHYKVVKDYLKYKIGKI